ncbi:ABC transporter permease [Bacillus marasmi]|uniref:ABC transporter permease n=1 Tax=Bacillus marasmi TaxID=1926279 RepID=UPI0011CAEB37|nr:ABC transporter permease [Bacillus marasmi]
MATVVRKIEMEETKLTKTTTLSTFHLASKFFKQSIVIISLLLLWEFAPRLGFVNPEYLPPFLQVLDAWREMLITGELWTHFSTSITRSIYGFLLALAVGIPLGLLIGWYPLMNELLNPAFEVYRNTATLALLPVFMLVLGIGEASKIAIVFYACTAEILLHTIAGVKNVDPLLIKSARSMNLSSYKLFTKVVLPAALPTIFVGIRMAGTGCILILMAAEMIGAKAGLGYLITFAQHNFQIAKMFAGILTISMLGLLVNIGLTSLERRVSRWQQHPNA